MDSRHFPAAYLAHFELGVTRLLREIEYNESRRTDDDPRIQKLAWIHPTLIDDTQTGNAVVLFGAVNAEMLDVGDHLHAFTPITR